MERRNPRGRRKVYGQEEGEGGGERTLVVMCMCVHVCVYQCMCPLTKWRSCEVEFIAGRTIGCDVCVPC